MINSNIPGGFLVIREGFYTFPYLIMFTAVLFLWLWLLTCTSFTFKTRKKLSFSTLSTFRVNPQFAEQFPCSISRWHASVKGSSVSSFQSESCISHSASVPHRAQPIYVCWKAWWSYELGWGEQVMMDELLTVQGSRVVYLNHPTIGELPARSWDHF